MNSAGFRAAILLFCALTRSFAQGVTLYTGGSDIYKSVDGGATWQKTRVYAPAGANENLYYQLNQTMGFGVLALAADTASPPAVYASMVTPGMPPSIMRNTFLFKTTDGGVSWKQTDAGLTTAQPATLSAAAVQVMAIDPRTPSIVYAGTYGDGVFKSTDAGATWRQTQLVQGQISGLAVDPSNSSVLYAVAVNKVYRSADAGGTWQLAGSVFSDFMTGYGRVTGLRASPLDSSTLFASAGLSSTILGVPSGPPCGIFKSNDSGKTWLPTAARGCFSFVTFDPTNPKTLYAGGLGDGLLGGHIVKSTDGGATWSAIDTGLTTKQISTVAVDPVTPSTVYANGEGADTLFKSTDGGATWKPLKNGPPPVTVPGVTGPMLNILIAVPDAGGAPGQGAIKVTATLDGAEWSGPVTFTISGPAGARAGAAVPAAIPDLPAGSYSITHQGGGPANAVFNGVKPAAVQELAGAATLAFTFQYSSAAPKAPSLAVSQDALSFSYQAGAAGPIEPQVISVGGLPDPVSFTASVATGSGLEWLSVTPAAGTTPQSVSVNVAAGLPAGMYTGTVSIASDEASNSPKVIAVTLAVTEPPRTVFVIHGIGQHAGAISGLAASLAEHLEQRAPGRFAVDADFDYGDCAAANPLTCPADCTISNGAKALARYIKEKHEARPFGEIVLVGYSMGGLIARDLILNNYDEVVRDHHVAALVTLGSPHLGYPYVPLDDVGRCPTLIREMFGDLRNRKEDSASCTSIASASALDCHELATPSGQVATVSKYLYELNSGWNSEDLRYPPGGWLAISGTFCSDGKRGIVDQDLLTEQNLALGCTDANPQNDGVVCDESARFLWPGAHGPTERYSDAQHSHTISLATGLIFCSSLWQGTTPLDNPAPPVITKIGDFLTATQ